VNAGKSRKRLEVRVQFEPNRIAGEYLASAYERVVPIVRRDLRESAEGRAEVVRDQPMRQAGGVR
jgi:hypothetical protein